MARNVLPRVRSHGFVGAALPADRRHAERPIPISGGQLRRLQHSWHVDLRTLRRPHETPIGGDRATYGFNFVQRHALAVPGVLQAGNAQDRRDAAQRRRGLPDCR